MVDGIRASTGLAHTEFLRTDGDRFELKSSGMLGALPIQAETWIEYDGFIWVKLVLGDQRPVTVSSLRLEIPVHTRHATLYNSDRNDSTGIGQLGRQQYFADFDPIGMKLSRRGWATKSVEFTGVPNPIGTGT